METEALAGRVDPVSIPPVGTQAVEGLSQGGGRMVPSPTIRILPLLRGQRVAREGCCSSSSSSSAGGQLGEAWGWG